MFEEVLTSCTIAVKSPEIIFINVSRCLRIVQYKVGYNTCMGRLGLKFKDTSAQFPMNWSTNKVFCDLERKKKCFMAICSKEETVS